MMKPSTSVLVLVTLVQVVSVLGFALLAAGKPVVMASADASAPLSLSLTLGPSLDQSLDLSLDQSLDLSALPASGVADLAAVLLTPDRWISWGLLVVAMLAACVHVAGRVENSLRAHRALRAAQAAPEGAALPPTASGPPTARAMARLYQGDESLGEQAPLLVGLAAAAVWPWLLARWPTLADALAAVAVLALLAAVLRGRRRAGRITQSWWLGFFAGWTWLLGCAALARLLQAQAGLSDLTAAILAVLLCAGGTFVMQLRLGRMAGFSIAVIWGLIAVAAATLSVNAALATVAVFGIASIALGLVRATT